MESRSWNPLEVMGGHASLHQAQERNSREAEAQAGKEGTREKSIYSYIALPKYFNKEWEASCFSIWANN